MPFSAADISFVASCDRSVGVSSAGATFWCYSSFAGLFTVNSSNGLLAARGAR